MTRSQEAHQVAEAERYDVEVFLESLKIILKNHSTGIPSPIQP